MSGQLAALALHLITGAYAGWQLRNLRAFARLPGEATAPPPPPARLCLVVPFRNERANLPTLVASLRAQRLPPGLDVEYCFVDDDSTDGGAAWLREQLADWPAARLLPVARLPRPRPGLAPKKAALDAAIASTDADWIVTTDADCHWPPDGLRQLATQFTPGTRVICCPVLCEPPAAPQPANLCHAYQTLDLLSYQFLTAASIARGQPALANGAAFAFRRRAFRAVGGYAGVGHLPSGDDVLLLHKFADYFPPEAFRWLPARRPVLTRPVEGWRALWRQRLRWAGKTGNYRSEALVLAQGITFVCCAALVVGTLGLPWLPARVRTALALAWAVKLLVDGLCLYAMAARYGRRRQLRWYPPVALLYPFFLTAVGAAALAGVRVSWRGRRG